MSPADPLVVAAVSPQCQVSRKWVADTGSGAALIAPADCSTAELGTKDSGDRVLHCNPVVAKTGVVSEGLGPDVTDAADEPVARPQVSRAHPSAASLIAGFHGRLFQTDLDEDAESPSSSVTDVLSLRASQPTDWPALPGGRVGVEERPLSSLRFSLPVIVFFIATLSLPRRVRSLTGSALMSRTLRMNRWLGHRSVALIPRLPL